MLMRDIDRCILIDPPDHNTPWFYGQWVSAAKKAERLFKDAYEHDTDYAEWVDALPFTCLFDLGITAEHIVRRLAQEGRPVFEPLSSDIRDEIVMLSELDFFDLLGDRYRMKLPPAELTSPQVRGSLYRYAETIDVLGALHPEQMVTTVSRAALNVDGTHSLSQEMTWNRMPYPRN